MEAKENQLTIFYITALEGQIMESYLKKGITDLQELHGHVHDEFPQLICDVVNPALIEAKKQGRREVVEWVKYCPNCGSYLPKNLNGTRTLRCRICDWDGQAQLKEWGIEQSQESSTSSKE